MIFGLEDQMAVLGHIKIGGLRPLDTRSGTRLVPEKHDYFTVTTAQRNKHGYGYETDAELMDILIKKDKTSKDKKLRKIMVMLPSDDMNENLVTNLAIYDGKGCRCRGDGKEAEFIDPRTSKPHKVKCPCQMLRIRLGKGDNPDDRPAHEKNIQPDARRGYLCKAHGILRVLILEAKTVGGIHLFRTTSSNSIKQLFASMRHISFLTGGVIANIPLALEVNPKRVRPAYSDKHQTVYVVNLTHKESNLGEFLMQVAKEYRLHHQMRQHIAGKEKTSFLPTPEFEDDNEQEEIAKEFWAANGIAETTTKKIETTESTEQDDKTEIASETPNNDQESPKTHLKKPPGTIPQIPLDQPVPLVLTSAPKNADERPANRDLRRKYINLGREAKLKDKTLRGWIKNLWDVESTGSMKTWQIMAMIEALDKQLKQSDKEEKPEKTKEKKQVETKEEKPEKTQEETDATTT